MKFDAREPGAGTESESGAKRGTESGAPVGAGAVREKAGPRGRPRLREPRRKLVALRLQLPLVTVLKALADRRGVSQGRILEICLTRYAKDLKS